MGDIRRMPTSPAPYSTWSPENTDLPPIRMAPEPTEVIRTIEILDDDIDNRLESVLNVQLPPPNRRVHWFHRKIDVIPPRQAFVSVSLLEILVDDDE